MAKVKTFIAELDALLAQSDIDAYFIHIENMQMLLLSHGHLKTKLLIDSYAKKWAAIKLWATRFLFLKPLLKKNNAKAEIEKLRNILHESNLHIAANITHKPLKKAQKRPIL